MPNRAARFRGLIKAMQTDKDLGRLQGWTSALHSFHSLAAEHDVDGAAILGQFGIPETAPFPPGCAVPTTSLFGAMAELGERAGCDGIAFQLLRRQTFRILGSIEQTVRSAPSLGAALERIVAVLHVHGTGYVSVLEHTHDVAVIRFRSLLPPGRVQDTQMDYNVGVAVLGIRGLIGSDWVPESIELIRPKPPSPSEWTGYFGCTVRFAADESLIVFNGADLAQPLAESASAVSLPTIFEDGVSVDFVHLIDREIIRELSTGKAKLGAVAAALGLNARTLQRRLAAMDTSFQQRLDAVRLGWAEHYLSNGQMSLTALSQMLGYGDLATFSRVFKGWSGMAPRDWRNTRQKTTDKVS